MKNYELLYIISNQYTEDEFGTIKDKVHSLLEKQGATLGFQEFLGKKKLSYPIDKVNHGYYSVVEFELEDGNAIATMTNDLKLDREILRAQIIAKPKITEKEIALQKRQRAKAAQEAVSTPVEKPAAKKEVRKKVDMKKLDEKLDELLGDDASKL